MSNDTSEPTREQLAAMSNEDFEAHIHQLQTDLRQRHNERMASVKGKPKNIIGAMVSLCFEDAYDTQVRIQRMREDRKAERDE